MEDARAAYIQRVVHCTELRDMPKARAAWLPRQSEIFDPEALRKLDYAKLCLILHLQIHVVFRFHT